MRKLFGMGLGLLLSITLAVGTGIAADANAQADVSGAAQIVDFVYDQGEGGFDGEAYCFNVYTDGDATYLSAIEYDEGGLDVMAQVDAAIYGELLELVKQYDLYAWNGFDEMPEAQEDDEEASVFMLAVEFEDETEIYAQGSLNYPENYEQVNAAVVDFFLTRVDALQAAGEGLEPETEADAENMEAY